MPKVVKSAGREMILKVKEFCEAEHKNRGVLIPISNVRKRVAAMTGKFWGCHIQIFSRLIYRLELSFLFF